MANGTIKNETLNCNYFFVRAHKQERKHFDVFFKKSVVGVGWSETRFDEFEDAKSLVLEIWEAYRYAKTNPQFAGRSLNQIRLFKNMSDGDRVIVPFYNSIRLATVGGNGEQYDESEIYTTDLANQRKVKYEFDDDGNLLTIPRSDLSEGLARRLRMRGTAVGNLWEFGDEIDTLFKNRSGWEANFQQKHKDLSDEFKKQLIENIRWGSTNLAAGGIGLEDLVVELLRLEGYDAKILPKKKFEPGADVDIKASKVDKITEVNVLIQVKHHYGETNSWGAEQLLNASRSPEYENHRLVVVTTGQPGLELSEKCEEKDIVLIDGEGFADWLYELIDKLDVSTRIKLGISEVPRFIE